MFIDLSSPDDFLHYRLTEKIFTVLFSGVHVSPEMAESSW